MQAKESFVECEPSNHKWWADDSKCRRLCGGKGIRIISEAHTKGFGILPSLDGMAVVSKSLVR